MNSARCAYESRRYKGSLAQHLGLHGREAQHGARGRRLWRWAALAALIGVSVYLFRANDESTPTSPATPQQAQRSTTPTIPLSLPDQTDTITDDNATWLADESTSVEVATEVASTAPESFQLSAPSTSISFTELTGLPSVSAMPAIGGLPSLESSGSTNSTTQESAS